VALPNWQTLTSLSCSPMSVGRALFFFPAPDVRAETAMVGVGSQGPMPTAPPDRMVDSDPLAKAHLR
jgi:hypothetical protein